MRLIRVRSIFLVLFLLSLLLSIPFSSSQLLLGSSISSSDLDAILQDYAFKAFFHPKTGVPYDAKLPKNLSGISVSAMRLKNGSLRKRGVHSYKEFQIPIGVVVQPYVERLVLVYHNLGNWSGVFYPLPGYSYLAPVLGLLAFSGTNLSASELPELDIRASDKPILIKFSNVKSAPSGSVAKCVCFDLHGSVQFDILLPGNACSTLQQGHFSIVVESKSPSSSSSPAPEPVAAVKENGGKSKYMVWIIVALVVSGFLLMFILSLIAARVIRTKKDMEIQQLECLADSYETLKITSIGSTKAPLAMGTRTKPILENDYIP